MYLARNGRKPVFGQGYDDFIPLFTTSLKSKSETVIGKYKGRTQIEQTNKELNHIWALKETTKRKRSAIMGIYSIFGV